MDYDDVRWSNIHLNTQTGDFSFNNIKNIIINREEMINQKTELLGK